MQHICKQTQRQPIIRLAFQTATRTIRKRPLVTKTTSTNSNSSRTISGSNIKASTTEHSKWRDLTNQLFSSSNNLIINNVPKLLHQGEECLKYWTKQKDLNSCFEILDHLAVKLSSLPATAQSRHRRLHTEAIINPIIKLWRHSVVSSNENMGSKALWPSEMSKKLKFYEQDGLIKMDKATHGMILDTSSQMIGRNQDYSKREGVIFAHSYLKEWIEAYQQQELVDTASNKKDNDAIVKPDIVAIGSVIQAWQKSGLPEAPIRAGEWIDVCKLLGFEPNAQLYTSVITAWAKQGNPIEAEKWMEAMKENNIVVDLAAWNALLLAWAHHAESPVPYRQHRRRAKSQKNDNTSAAKAHSILQHMIHLYNEGKLSDPPDVISYSTVLDALSRQLRKETNFKEKQQSAQKALRLLQQMKDSPHSKTKPNTVSYNLALATCARAGLVPQAESLLKEMITSHQSTFGHDSDGTLLKTETIAIGPNIQSISLLLLAYAKVGTVDAAEKAESIMKESLPLLGMEPNLISYNNCISCWANASTPYTNIPVERATKLFREISHVHGMDPDAFAYTTLINAWGRNGNAQQAQSLLDELWDKYKTAVSNQDRDADSYKPTVQTLTSVLHAWAASDPEQAEVLLQRMVKDYEVVPNVYSFSVVLNAWAKHSSSPKYPDGPDRALAILNFMEESSSSKSNNKGVRPNIVSYTTVIQAFAKQGRAVEAEGLLQRMLDSETNLPKPDLRAFSAVLHAWSKSKDPRAAERAEAFLVQMHDMYQSKDLDKPPNVYCYTNVLACLANAKNPGSGPRALAILRSMMNSTAEVSPNLVSYNNVLNALANEIAIPNGGETDLALIQEIFKLLDGLVLLGEDNPRMKPDKWTYQAVLKSLKNTRSRKKVEYVNALLDVINKQRFEPTLSMKKQIRKLMR